MRTGVGLVPPGGRHCLWTSVPRAQAHFRTIGVCGAETFAVFRSDGWWRYSAWVLVRCVSRNAPMGGAVLFEEKGTCKLGRYHEQQPCTPLARPMPIHHDANRCGLAQVFGGFS